MADVIAYLVAAIAAVCGVVWIGLGITGWTGLLRRNRYFGIRSEETMRSAAAFSAANRVVAPGLVATGMLALVAAGLAFSQRGIAGIVLGVVGLIVALVLVGLLSAAAIRSVAALPPDEEPAGCGDECGCGGHAASEDEQVCATHTGEADICESGTGGCGSCEMRDACFDEPTRA
ncbi:SdpI family protein [Gordonia sp. X0973]|uniref:SdpI family protein n=1 Tax=Gordonia sp. X0973 TaxID=2742602 RepID=UPI000F540E0E|nr:SdpI family protein [Gordonia sp. X0973]QKT08914.1 SdpI family protein [Gordonia sp. X0973]